LKLISRIRSKKITQELHLLLLGYAVSVLAKNDFTEITISSRKDAKNAKEIHKMINFIDPGWLYYSEK